MFPLLMSCNSHVHNVLSEGFCEHAMSRSRCARQVDDVQVEVALQWCSDAFSDTIVGFVNSIKTIDGGTHMDGATLNAPFVHTFYMPMAS